MCNEVPTLNISADLIPITSTLKPPPRRRGPSPLRVTNIGALSGRPASAASSSSFVIVTSSVSVSGMFALLVVGIGTRDRDGARGHLHPHPQGWITAAQLRETPAL